MTYTQTRREQAIVRLTEALAARPDYEPLEELSGAAVPFRLRHTVCGYEWQMTPVNFHKGRGCPICNGGHSSSADQGERFRYKVANRFGTEYEVVGDYRGTHVPILFRHSRCGKEFKVSPTNFLKKTAATRCIYCQREERMSQGERAIVEWLTRHNIAHTFQWKDPRLNEEQRDYRFGFDFRVDLVDGSFCLIEYHGELHYRPWRGESRQAEEKFRNTQRCDKLKLDFCERHGIPLLVIPYTELYRIGAILSDYFDMTEGSTTSP